MMEIYVSTQNSTSRSTRKSETFLREKLRQTSQKEGGEILCDAGWYVFLRNLVSGYEFGRAFPIGVGPGSPSRDAANWLPSRFGLSVETRRRYGWLRMVYPGVCPFRAPYWCPSGGWRHARGRDHCRGESGNALSGGYAPDSAKAEGSSIVDEPREGWTPVRENQRRENLEFSEGKADVWLQSFFFLRGPQGAANGQDSRVFFKDAQGFRWPDAGSRAGFTSSRPPPPPWTSVFQFSLFLYDVWPWET